MNPEHSKQSSFYSRLFALVLPMAAQNLLNALLSASDALMLGLLEKPDETLKKLPRFALLAVSTRCRATAFPPVKATASTYPSAYTTLSHFIFSSQLHRFHL